MPTISKILLGGLNLSRAIGDHAYKKTLELPPEEQAITALPDVRTLTLEDQDEFMIIACDGIWNFMSSQDVIDFIRYRLETKSLSQICEEVSVLVCFYFFLFYLISKKKKYNIHNHSYLCIVWHQIQAVMEPVAII